ncbi:MAG: hypothetical protein ACTJGF_03780, partial [Corynebacterium sp.]
HNVRRQHTDRHTFLYLTLTWQRVLGKRLCNLATWLSVGTFIVTCNESEVDPAFILEVSVWIGLK